MQDLMDEMTKTRDTLTTAIELLKKRGQDKAQAYAEYRRKRAVLTLKLLDDKMAVTVLQDVVRGDREVSKAKLDLDIADTLYETCLQKIYQCKLEIQLIENQMKYERMGQ